MKRRPAGQPNGGQYAPSAVPAPTAAPKTSPKGETWVPASADLKSLLGSTKIIELGRDDLVSIAAHGPESVIQEKLNAEEKLNSEDGVNVYDQEGQAVDLNALYKQFEAAEKKSNSIRDQYNSEYNAGKWTTNRDLAGKAEDAYSEMLRADQKFKAAARAEEQGMVTKFYTVLDTDANDLHAQSIQDEQDITFEQAREHLEPNEGAGTKQEMLLAQYAIVRGNCSEEDRINVEEALMDPARTDNATRRAFANETSDEDLIFRLAERAAAGDRFIQDGLSRNASYRGLFS